MIVSDGLKVCQAHTSHKPNIEPANSYKTANTKLRFQCIVSTPSEQYSPNQKRKPLLARTILRNVNMFCYFKLL